MKKHLIFFSVSILLCATLIGCNKSDSGSSVTSSGVTTSLTMTGSGQPAIAQTSSQKFFSLFIPSAIALTPPALEDSNAAPITLSEAWIVVEEIEFEAEELASDSEVDGDEVEFEGPFFVDLLSDAPVSFGDMTLPGTGIKRVKMQLHEAETLPASAPLELDSKSILIKGSVNGVSFSYAADDSTEFEISGSNPVVPSSAKDMLIVIRMADLFKKIDLSSVTVPTDIHAGNRVAVAGACPLIDASANDLYDCFRKGLSSEGNLGNDDGDLDLDEADDSVD